MVYQSSSNDPSSFKPPASFPKMSIGNKAGNLFKNKWVVIVLAVIVAGLASWFVYSYIDTRNQLAKLSDPNTQQKAQSEELVKIIGKFMQLPDEVPTTATVKEASKLKGQEFFQNAQDGDKVLIFSKSGRALLYRESTKMVIEYSKVDLSGVNADATKK